MYKYLFALLLLMLDPSIARSDTLTFSTGDSPFTPGADNQGWWSNGLTNSNINDFTSFGIFPVPGFGGRDLHGYFTFDLSTLSGTVTSATLELILSNYNSSDAHEVLELYDVSTSAAALSAKDGNPNAMIYADLGSGTSYGAYTIDSFAGGQTFILTLNANAIAAINSQAGGFFSIGGALTSLSGTSDTEYLGGATNAHRLTVETESVNPVPLPAAAWMGMGLIGMVGARSGVRRWWRGRAGI